MAAVLLTAILLIFSICSSAQNTGNVSIGASITAADNSNPWRSPSGDFAFGFQRLSNDKNLFILSIWFDKIPEKTIVWYEKESYPVPRGSTVQLDAANGTVVTDPRGRVLYRTSGFSDRVAYGFMNDSGNFVLFRASNSTPVWESFKNPTDTILPTQTVEIGGELISKKTQANFSQGRFYGRMKEDGSFILGTKSLPTNNDFDDVYYTNPTSDGDATNSGKRLVFDDRAFLYIMMGNGQRSPFFRPSGPPSSENYYRATLDFDGMFVQYYYPKNTGNNTAGWNLADAWPRNICNDINGGNGSGAYGYNNVCSLVNGRPKCQCPQGFSLADPDNKFSDCLANYVQSCVQGDQQGSQEDQFELLNVSDVDWPWNDYQTIQPCSINECYSFCLNDCFCGAAIFRSNTCWKKRLPLSNGKVDTSLGVQAFLKLRKEGVQPGKSIGPGKPRCGQGTVIIIVSTLLGSSVLVNFLLIGIGCFGFFLIYNKRSRSPIQSQTAQPQNLRCFTYKELVQSTNNFKEEVGRGSFGIVYKGIIATNGTFNGAIAVKKLDRVSQDFEKEFRTEVTVIGQTHHKNLVRLIGFCDEGPHRLLVYEYMSNGTLASLLFSSMRPSWALRGRIALGIARGLTYLHEECSTQIIHCDIKPQNILLDDYHNARISDFGLAKLLVMDQSRTLTNIRGTKGYVAPEWFRNTRVTAKVDVYSFDVMLLEIVTCRRNVELGGDENVPILTDLVWDQFKDGQVHNLVEGDDEALNDKSRLKRFVTVGIWCMQEDVSVRPTMRRACQMLEGVVEVEAPPCPFLFNSLS